MAVPKSELLALLDQRYKDLIENAPDVFKRPVLGGDKRIIERACRLHAEANNADPFAYVRAMKDVKQGYVSIGDLEHDARNVLSARHARTG